MTVALIKEWGNKLPPKPYSGYLFCHSYVHIQSMWFLSAVARGKAYAACTHVTFCASANAYCRGSSYKTYIFKCEYYNIVFIIIIPLASFQDALGGSKHSCFPTENFHTYPSPRFVSIPANRRLGAAGPRAWQSYDCWLLLSKEG